MPTIRPWWGTGPDELCCLASGHWDVGFSSLQSAGAVLLSEERICLPSQQAQAQDIQCVCKRDARKQDPGSWVGCSLSDPSWAVPPSSMWSAGARVTAALTASLSLSSAFWTNSLSLPLLAVTKSLQSAKHSMLCSSSCTAPSPSPDTCEFSLTRT